MAGLRRYGVGPKAETDRMREAFAPFLIEPKASEDPKREDWVAYCPSHETPGRSRPSAEICFNDGRGGSMWYCHVCSEGGSNAHLDALYQLMIERDDYAAIKEGANNVTDIAAKRAAKRDPKEGNQPLTQFEVHDLSYRLQSNKELMAYLAERRGVTEETVAQHGIGWLHGSKAFTIPLYGPDGELVNVRKSFKDPKPDMGKIVWHHNGGDHPLLFGDLIAGSQEVIIVEGEWDAILARQLGLNAITSMRGASGWNAMDTKALAGKPVTLLMDNDKAGHEGERKIKAAILKAKLSTSLRVVRHEVTGADFSDMVLLHGWDGADFRAHIAKVEPVPTQEASDLPTSGRRVHFSALTSRNSAKEIVEGTVLVDARIGQSKLPWRGEYHCAEDQGKKCLTCPLGIGGGKMAMALDRQDRDTYLPLIDVKDTEAKRHLMLLNAFACNKFEIHRDEDIDVEHLLVTAPVLGDVEDGTNTGKVTTTYLVGSHDSEAGDIIKVVGRNASDAKRQSSVFMAWHKEQDNPLREHKVLTPQEDELLRDLRPPNGTSVYAHHKEVAADILQQYGIIDRDDLGAAYLLTYGSPLDIMYRGVAKHGWIQGMVVGDTRTGKTAAADAIMQHMGYGSMIKCDVTSRAGLIGGRADHPGTGSYLKMGLLPRADGRMVFLDETTNILNDGAIMKQLTDMRSSGKMSINFIDSTEFRCRVRQVWISNPPNGMPMSRFANKGIDAIDILVKTQQDIARFDWLFAVGTSDETGRIINSGTVERHDSIFSRTLMRLIIEWIWTRTLDDIVFAHGVEDYIGRIAQAISTRYSSERYNVIPSTEAAIKVARFAAAFAAFQYSTDNGVRVIVKMDHVDAVEEFLDAMLGSPDLGLAEYCAAESAMRALAAENIEWLKEVVATQDHYYAAARWLSGQSGSFRTADVDAALEGIGFGSGVVGELRDRGLITMATGSYNVSSTLREVLGSMKNQQLLNSPTRPSAN